MRQGPAKQLVEMRAVTPELLPVGAASEADTPEARECLVEHLFCGVDDSRALVHHRFAAAGHCARSTSVMAFRLHTARQTPHP